MFNTYHFKKNVNGCISSFCPSVSIVDRDVSTTGNEHLCVQSVTMVGFHGDQYWCVSISLGCIEVCCKKGKQFLTEPVFVSLLLINCNCYSNTNDDILQLWIKTISLEIKKIQKYFSFSKKTRTDLWHGNNRQDQNSRKNTTPRADEVTVCTLCTGSRSWTNIVIPTLYLTHVYCSYPIRKEYICVQPDPSLHICTCQSLQRYVF